MNRETAIALIIRIEGGYVDNPADPGGATKYGITQRTLDGVHHQVFNLPKLVQLLTPDQATGIYRVVQWADIAGDQLSPALACLLLNAAVNQGTPTAVKALQGAVGVPEDGKMGPGTLAAVGRWRSPYMPEQSLAEEFAAHVAVRYAELNGKLGTFELGWMRRLMRVYTVAVSP